jgi:hypothetical protein
MEGILDLLPEYYYDLPQYSSYQRPDVQYYRLKQDYPPLKKIDLVDWFRNQRTYLLFKNLARKYRKNPIVSKVIDHIWNIDLVELAHPEENNGYRYILCAIDNLSKFAWIRALQNKQQGTVRDAFQDIIDTSGRRPQIVGADVGPEFNNNTFKNFLEQQNIRLYLLYAPDKAVLAERFIQTLKFRIYRYLHRNNTNNFIQAIDQIVDNYNNSVHSRTKFRPIDVNQENQRQCFLNLYKYSYKTLEKQKFNVGDRVFIPIYVGKDPTKMRARFRQPRYDPDVHVIEKVLFTSPRYKYVVRKPNGNIIRNTFYADQLVKTNLLN